MKIFLIIFLCTLELHLYSQFDANGPVNKEIFSTVIEIQKGKETGSGFLVAMGQKLLLITNKHLVGDWSPVDSLLYNDSLYIYPYSTRNNESSFLKVGIKISNHGVPLFSKIKVHSNHKIDIAVIDITADIGNLEISETNYIDTTFFLKLNDAQRILTYGSQVFTIDYPAGMKPFKTNQPLLKTGYLSSSLNGNLVMEQNWINRRGVAVKTLTDGKIFIVDGLIIPGNSGGPVIISQEVIWFKIDGKLQHSDNLQNYFIGIVSNIYTNTGLATIFSSDNILEVIREFK